MQRSTKQSRAIERVLLESERPLSPGEVQDAASAEVPGIGLATVYRQLRTLVESGTIRSVELPGLPARYERAEMPHHHHFHCERCDRVFDLEGCAGELGRLLPRGFRPIRHEITFFGLCAQCARQARTERKSTPRPRRR